MKKIMIVVSYLSLSACSTMHFTNGPQIEQTVVREQWHHLTFNALIEMSPPLDLQYNCGQQQWDTVTIEQTFLNGFVSTVSQPFPYISLYTPWTITYSCREPID